MSRDWWLVTRDWRLTEDRFLAAGLRSSIETLRSREGAEKDSEDGRGYTPRRDEKSA